MLFAWQFRGEGIVERYSFNAVLMHTWVLYKMMFLGITADPHVGKSYFFQPYFKVVHMKKNDKNYLTLYTFYFLLLLFLWETKHCDLARCFCTNDSCSVFLWVTQGQIKWPAWFLTTEFNFIAGPVPSTGRCVLCFCPHSTERWISVFQVFSLPYLTISSPVHLKIIITCRHVKCYRYSPYGYWYQKDLRWAQNSTKIL